MNTQHVISPYGGKLVNLIISDKRKKEFLTKAKKLPPVTLSDLSLFDLELLAVGGFSPLTRFMGSEDYTRVVEDMRLSDGTLFPIPITLPVSSKHNLKYGRDVSLVSQRNEIVAILRVEEIFKRSQSWETQRVFGTKDSSHPFVAEMSTWGRYCVSGEIKAVLLPTIHSFLQYRYTPKKLRKRLVGMGWKNVVSFQTRNPLHRGHEELIKRAIDKVNGTLLLQPSVGITAPGDLDFYLRIRSYESYFKHYFDEPRAMLNILPIAMRLAGPRSAIWHAIIRRNYGANYFIVGRYFANPGKDTKGRPFYEENATQNMATTVKREVGVKILPFSEIVYLPKEKRYEEKHLVPKNKKTYLLSGSTVREKFLKKGRTLPSWFMRPKIALLLRDTYPALYQRGFCIWFTGLPCSGKSTIGEIVSEILQEYGKRVTLLDGDAVRKTLSAGLGYSKKHRALNLMRLAFVAKEIVRHNGVVIVCAISPYEEIRNKVRHMIGEDCFILVHVATPTKVCKLRDVKGMYEKAEKGILKQFTGVSDPYEKPSNAAVTVSNNRTSAKTTGYIVIKHLSERGFLKKRGK